MALLARQSPFRESEWDRRLDNMLDDLESSNNNVQLQQKSSSQQQASSSSSSAAAAAFSSKSFQQSSSSSSMMMTSSAAATSSSSASKNLGASRDFASKQNALANQRITGRQQQQGENFGLVKSGSRDSVGDNADNMLKDLEGSLKASTSYIESHRSYSGPDGSREYHDVQRYENGQPVHSSSTKKIQGSVGGTDDDFNLERQVQHMMPQGSFDHRNKQLAQQQQNGGSSRSYSSNLQSANMVSSMQQSSQSSSSKSYTTYKVQSNQYGGANNNYGTNNNVEDGDRPGSRLKQNIDELDNLLYDLNNARKISDAGGDYTASSITPGAISTSDDYGYHDGPRRAAQHQSRSEYRYEQTTTSGGGNQPDFARKPPSPSPRRRPNSGGGSGSQSQPPLSSPGAVRKLSPGRATSNDGRYTSSSSYNYQSSSSYSNTQQQQQTTSTSGGPGYDRERPTYDSRPGPRRSASPPQRLQSPPVPLDGNTPTGAAYYTKYHSTHTHHSQNTHTPPPASFPQITGTPKSTPKNQLPPARVDDLMTELSEFDSSIKTTGYASDNNVDPITGKPIKYYREPSPDRYKYREHTPPPQMPKQPYSGEMYGTNSSYRGPINATVQHETTLETDGGKGKGKAKGEVEYKTKENWGKTEGEGKQGAAVVPICLPLCCAAPCVIM